MNINFSVEILLLCFVLYWFILSKLINAILEAPKLKEPAWLLVGMFNAGMITVTVMFATYDIWGFYVMMALMLAEFMIFYKDTFLGALLCTLACVIHVASIFIMTIGVVCLSRGVAPYEVLTDESTVVWCATIAFILLDIAILTVIRVVPLSKVKLINQHREQQLFMDSWMFISGILLLYMESLFHNPNYPLNLVVSQIVVAVAVLIGLYIVLFFSIKTGAILGYKEKNAELEQAIYQEQQYRNSMVWDAIASYEINVTQNIFIKGAEEQMTNMGAVSNCYNDIMVLMAQKTIYSEDIDDFVKKHGRTNILRLFEKGEVELIAEYRRLLETGEYAWVRTIINLVQDIETKDVKAFVCVKNIDEEKRNQLELQHQAERDPLTGLYNRNTTSKLIDEYLAFDGSEKVSALFMIDVDDFKDINDHLGHLYGDAVLGELADKLTHLCRSNDIVGRIGGDEYMVFLKDCVSAQKAEEKAAEICKAFHATYQSGGTEKYTISSSVGIAVFSQDGKTFKELYGSADIALYEAKSEGKNKYKLYDGSGFAGYSSQRTEIQTSGNTSQKGFKENRIEYVFKMLYESENPVAAIRSVLELVARHFSFGRGYIFETSKDGNTTSNTFEWCADGVEPQIENLQNLPIEAVATANLNFQKKGTFILKDIKELEQAERAVLEPQNIKSMFQFGIFDKSHLLGFIGFDNCQNEANLNDVEIDEMKTICNVLSTFFVKQYIDEVSAKDLKARQEVMNHLENFIYVINAKTFEILFMNKKTKALLDDSKHGSACYGFFRGKTSQCEDCPVRRLVSENLDRSTAEVYNDHLGLWLKSSASIMRWTDGSIAYLINCADITKQKEEHLHHVQELESLIYVDTLIGCPSYYKFQMDAQQILEEQADQLHFLVKLDVANFKLINQLYGYEKGNEILCCVAKAIEGTLRNDKEIFARVGNDEFIALFTIKEKADIEELNKTFVDNFHRLIGDDFSFKCRFPHGRYLIDPQEKMKMSIKDMFEKANIAHKAAKSNKALEFAFYDDNMTSEALHVKEIENKMAEALDNNEFSVFMQPKYYLKDETIGGAEALVRWKNENLDLFFPNTFIPIFEQNGFITKLDLHVFEKVCKVIKQWIAAGVEPVPVSVNFSRLHLGNINFVAQLREIVDRIGIERRYLEIEITEAVIFDNIEMLELLLNDIHESGFTMSMDDFGSGYSSLGMLKNLPVDVIKMDRSFFADQRDAERARTVVGSVIRMASELGIRIVAEGVEEQPYIDFLRELNCDMVQGYYFARPMEVGVFTELLQKERASKKPAMGELN